MEVIYPFASEASSAIYSCGARDSPSRQHMKMRADWSKGTGCGSKALEVRANHHLLKEDAFRRRIHTTRMQFEPKGFGLRNRRVGGTMVSLIGGLAAS